ncbi:hypothetical protein ACFX19_024139 [Malus domestica]
MNMMIEAAGAGNLPVTGSSSTPSSPSHHPTSEAGEHYRQSSSKALHKRIIFAIPTLAGFIQLRYGAGAAVYLWSTEYGTLVALIVAIVVYISSWALAVKIFPARENPDLSEFMDKISLSSGTLAITLELLIIVPALGWFAMAAWSICLVIAVTKSYHEIADVLKSLYQTALEQLLQVFKKLKELFMNIRASAGIVASGMVDKLKEFMNIGESAGVVASGMFDKLKQLVMGSDQPNGASASAGDVEKTSAAV